MSLNETGIILSELTEVLTYSSAASLLSYAII